MSNKTKIITKDVNLIIPNVVLSSSYSGRVSETLLRKIAVWLIRMHVASPLRGSRRGTMPSTVSIRINMPVLEHGGLLNRLKRVRNVCHSSKRCSVDV